MSAIAVPRYSVWSMPIGVITATRVSTMLVASHVPPMPTSTTATSTGASAKAANAMRGDTSNLLIADRPPPSDCSSTMLDERLDLAVDLDVARRVIGWLSMRCARSRLQVRAGVPAGARSQGVNSASTMRDVDVLPFVPASVDDRVRTLRVAPSSVRQRLDPRPCSARASSRATAGRAGARPAAASDSSGSVPTVLGLPAARPGASLMRSTSARRRPALRDLGVDARPAPWQERLVAELPASCSRAPSAPAARSFSSRLRSAATSTVPDVSSSTITVPLGSRPPPRRGGGEPVAGLGEPRQRVHGRDLVDQADAARAADRARPSADRPDPDRCGTGGSR